jgi:hypothetical protein
MDNVSRDQLTAWRAALEKELSDVEVQLEPLRTKVSELRSQINAIDVLLKPLEDTMGGGGTPPSDTRISELILALDNGGANFTPTDAYWIPILEGLEELGGSGRTDDVLDRVEKKMANVLRPEDYEMLPSGISIRWRNRAQWQRQNMVQQGLISANSRRGIWELTSKGREWLKQERQKLRSLLEKYGMSKTRST